MVHMKPERWFRRSWVGRLLDPFESPLFARHFGGPSIPPPPVMPDIKFPEPVAPTFTFEFPAPEQQPQYDPNKVEQEKAAKAQEELRTLIARRARGRYGTIQNAGGAAGLPENAPVSKPTLLGSTPDDEQNPANAKARRAAYGG